MSGWFRGAGATHDVRPRARGPIEWQLPEPALFGLDGRRDLLLKLDATLVNRGTRPVLIQGATLAGAAPEWNAPRAEWYENGSVRRAVFRAEPWLPLSLEPGARHTRGRLLFVVARDRVPRRGAARLPLELTGEPFGTLRFEVRAAPPVLA